MLEDELLDAVFKKDLQRVEELIEEGVDVNVFDMDNVTPLMYSVIASDYETARLLVENGADVNYEVLEGKFKGDTALKIAELLDNKKMQNILLGIDDEDMQEEEIVEEQEDDSQKNSNKEKNKFIKLVLLVFLICAFLFICLYMFGSTFSFSKTILFACLGICIIRLLYFFKF
jgi:ankyrin repeat protein